MRLPSLSQLLAAASLIFALPCHADLETGVAAYYAKDYAKAEAALRPLAEMGDPDASFYLGEVYLLGYNNRKDDYTAFRMLSRAARAQIQAASVDLLQMRRLGMIQPGAFALKPAEWNALIPLEAPLDDPKRADQVDPDTLALVATAHCETPRMSNNPEELARKHYLSETADYLKRAAQAGQPQAQFSLGMAYIKGNYCESHVLSNVQSSVNWLRKAGDGGVLQAQVVLADIAYERVPGSDLDVKEALARLKSAAEAGSPEACLTLGDFYLNGIGTTVNAAAAARWYQRALELDEPNAPSRLAGLYLAGSGVERSSQKATALWQQGAERGDPLSQWKLAGAYGQGVGGVKKDVNAHIHWLQMAADNEETNAQYDLALELLSGKTIETDEKKGIDYLTRAARRGYGAAQLKLGAAYAEGRGVGKNVWLAYGLYLLAQQKQVPHAQAAVAALKPKLTEDEALRGQLLAETWRPHVAHPGDMYWPAWTDAPPPGLEF